MTKRARKPAPRATGSPGTAEAPRCRDRLWAGGLFLLSLAKESDDPGAVLRQAETQLREAAGQDPGRAKPRVELGKVLARQGRNLEAIEVYRGAAVIEPADYRIPYALGLLHRRDGDAAAAEDSFRRALALAPGQARCATRLGEALLEQGRAGS